MKSKNNLYLGHASLQIFVFDVNQNAELKFNFGGEDFKHTPKSGFVALDQAPEANIHKSSQTGVWSQLYQVNAQNGIY